MSDTMWYHMPFSVWLHFFLHWRIIALQPCVGFCCPAMHSGRNYIHHPSPLSFSSFLPSLTALTVIISRSIHVRSRDFFTREVCQGSFALGYKSLAKPHLLSQTPLHQHVLPISLSLKLASAFLEVILSSAFLEMILGVISQHCQE